MAEAVGVKILVEEYGFIIYNNALVSLLRTSSKATMRELFQQVASAMSKKTVRAHRAWDIQLLRQQKAKNDPNRTLFGPQLFCAPVPEGTGAAAGKLFPTQTDTSRDKRLNALRPHKWHTPLVSVAGGGVISNY